MAYYLTLELNLMSSRVLESNPNRGLSSLCDFNKVFELRKVDCKLFRAISNNWADIVEEPNINIEVKLLFRTSLLSIRFQPLTNIHVKGFGMADRSKVSNLPSEWRRFESQQAKNIKIPVPKKSAQPEIQPTLTKPTSKNWGLGKWVRRKLFFLKKKHPILGLILVDLLLRLFKIFY